MDTKKILIGAGIVISIYIIYNYINNRKDDKSLSDIRPPKNLQDFETDVVLGGNTLGQNEQEQHTINSKG